MPTWPGGRTALAVAAATIGGGMIVAVPATPAVAQVAPVDNPQMTDACGVNVTLVLDASGSIQTSHAVDQVRGAAQAFLDALVDTDSTARVTQFGTVSAQLAPDTLVDGAALAPGGALADAITGYYNPRPPKPPGVDFWQYDGTGSPNDASNFRAGTATEWTNWDQALDQAGTGTAPELVVFVTDGDPTAYDFGQSGDPFPAPAVAYNTERGQAAATTLDRAVEEANAIKTAGTRMLAVGVGAAINNPASEQRLVDVSGPQVVRDLGTITNINQVDVALVEEFSELAAFLRGVVLELCSPSLTVRKLAQSASDTDYLPAPGWSITAFPFTTNGQFRWILPPGGDQTTPTKTLTTDANGFAQFQWEPVPPEQNSLATVFETVQPGYTAGRPGVNNDFRCELRNEDGDVRVVTGELSGTPAGPAFQLDPIGQEIVTCSVWNSFNYAPAIGITKTNVPTAVRGDLDPPATVTSNYAVTNPGNTPLDNVIVTDDKCAPVVPVPPSGTGTLDPGETWNYTCTHPIQVSGGGAPVAVVNTATAGGTDPTGTRVTGTATGTVTAYVPAIAVSKQVAGGGQGPASEITVPTGTPVTYTYAVTNTGNTPLTVTLTDDTPPCTSPTPSASNSPPPLLPGQTWNYTCGPNPAGASATNTATASGIPLLPTHGNPPFPMPNPPVTATAHATLNVVDPGVQIEKSADPTIVVIPPGGSPQPVTYTYNVTNTGDVPLNRPGASAGGPGPTDPGWIVDDTCTPVTYVSGDVNDNNLIDPDETWVFECAASIGEPTDNVAEISAQPSNPDGTPLPGVPPVGGEATAFVDVLTPDIDVVKTALVPVVLDPDADPVEGPDFPDPRPAQYLYEVTNTGNVPLELDPPPVDDVCSPLVFIDGDTDDNDLLGPDETWTYGCETVLDPATPGVVTNTVTATGIPVLNGREFPSISTTDQAQVLVIDPGIAIIKSASADIVLVGGDVTYTYSVINTGDTGLEVLGPVDDECTPLEFVGGDGNGDGVLDPDESWIYECTRALGLPTPPAVVDINTATVAGIDPLGNVYEAVDSAAVRVFDPAISLTKTVNEPLVPAGTQVTYSFEVTNTGDSPLPADDVLAVIELTDESEPALPSCDSPTRVSGSGDLLPRGVVWVYQCSAMVTAPTTDIAVVRGTAGTQFQRPLPVIVTDLDAAFVQTFTPGISVTKTAAPAQLSGRGQVVYTYVVRNTGDVPLSGIRERITDDKCAPLTYVSGDEDGDGRLDTNTSIFEDQLDETWTFTCTATVSATTTNTVVVTGTPTDPNGNPLCGTATIPPCDVTGTTTATVTLAAGTITITKRTPSATNESFDFRIDDKRFTLQRNESESFTGLAPGRYRVTEDVPEDWRLERIECVDATGDTVVGLGAQRVEIVLGAGETVTCAFHNRAEGKDLPKTGNDDLGDRLGMGGVLLGLGAALVVLARRRRVVS